MKKHLHLCLVFAIASTLIPYSAWAAGTVRYVATTGSDATSCTNAQNIGTPKLTITSAIACMAAGDITYVRTGTYTETIGAIIPAGVSNSVRTVISAYNDESVTVNLGGGTHGIYIRNKDNITLHGIDWDRGANAPTSNGNTSNAIKLESGVDNFTISGPTPVAGVYKCKVRGGGHDGLNVQGVNSNILLENCEITGNGVNELTAPYAHGAYFQRVTGLTITGNYFHTNGCYQMQVYPYTQNAVISGNHFKGNPTTSPCASTVNLANSGHIFERNVLEREVPTGGFGLRLQYGTGGTPSNMIVRHNTIVGNWNACIYIASNGNANTIQNNILNGCTTKIDNLGTNTVLVDNLTTGTASDLFTSVSAGAYNLTLKAGSVAIDGGTNIGLAYNNTFPDQGAYEVPVFSACEVRAAATSAVRVTFINNLRPPMLPASGVTGVTFRKNGASNAVLSSARVGDNQYDFTVTNSYAGGDTVDVSIVPASTNLTDSALIGSTSNQPFVSTLTNTACTNNAAGASAAVLTQTKFRVHGLYGAEASPIVKAVTNANYSVVLGGAHRLRIKIAGTVADPEPTGLQLRVSHNGGAYTALADAYVNHVKMYAATHVDIPDGAATTEQLTSDHATNVAGAVVSYAHAVPNLDLSQDSEAELEYVVQYENTAVVGDTYDYRLYTNSGDALTAYTVTPRITMKQSQATGGY